MPRKISPKVIASRYEGLSKEDKKEIVLGEGYSQIEYMCCPLCNWWKTIESRRGRIRYDNVDVVNGEVFQVRYAGGRGSGFHSNPAESMTLSEVNKDPQYADLIEQIKEQCQAILKVLE